MSESWSDINAPGFFVRNRKQAQDQGRPVIIEEHQSTNKEKDILVKLNRAYWKTDQVCDFNNEAILIVEGEFLKETGMSRITGDLYVQYDGEEEDLHAEAAGNLTKEGTAELNVKLYFGKKYYDARFNNPDAACHYIVKNIHHSCGNTVLESNLLEMPQAESNTLKIRLDIDPDDEASQDDTFRLYSSDKPGAYDKTLTVKADKTPGDGYLDLEFTGLDESSSYSLEINPGKEGDVYLLFKNVPYKDLKND
jgi:hypothetical protein